MDIDLQTIDTNLFHKINNDWINVVFDTIMPYIRESIIWVPLYIFLILMGYYNFGKQGVYWILAAIITVIISNYISSDIIKPFYNRSRPCADSYLNPAANLLLNRCPSSGSFTSSHATNHFALAVFFYSTLKQYSSYAKLFFVWAALISYAQIYVGVHFPLDVVGGALIGCTIGYLFSSIFTLKFGLLQTLTKL